VTLNICKGTNNRNILHNRPKVVKVSKRFNERKALFKISFQNFFSKYNACVEIASLLMAAMQDKLKLIRSYFAERMAVKIIGRVICNGEMFTLQKAEFH